MATQFAKVRKFAALAVMTTAMTAVGLSLGSGTAQARPIHSCPMPQMTICNTIQLHNQIADNFFDGVQGLFGVGEGTRIDHTVDRFFGVK
jgi:hypothetical protein